MMTLPYRRFTSAAGAQFFVMLRRSQHITHFAIFWRRIATARRRQSSSSTITRHKMGELNASNSFLAPIECFITHSAESFRHHVTDYKQFNGFRLLIKLLNCSLAVVGSHQFQIKFRGGRRSTGLIGTAARGRRNSSSINNWQCKYAGQKHLRKVTMQYGLASQFLKKCYASLAVAFRRMGRASWLAE